MHTKIGIWLDHRQAVIVSLTADGLASTLVIASKVERQLSRAGGHQITTHFEAYQVPADDHQMQRFAGHLDRFYDAVIATVRAAEVILIFGPGEAKTEFRKRIVKAGLKARIEAVETTDKLTERQIVAKVRQHFLPGAATAKP